MNSKFKNKKVFIIGSGFRAMMTAFYCSKEAKDINIISNNKNIHGVMSPINWLGGKFDKGYHFFDGFNAHNKKILENLVGEENLFDFGYGAATYTNNKVYTDHGIPYWPSKGIIFSLISLFQYLLLAFKKNKEIKNYDDLLKTLPKNINQILNQACIRNTNLSPDKLSHLVSRYSHFLCYRQSLLPDFLSNLLKKIDYFDARLASRRKTLGLEQISLYPRGKYIGFVSEIMERKLKDLGVKFVNSNEIKISRSGDMMKINYNEHSAITDYIFIVTELDNALNLFNDEITKKKNNHYVSQILYYFATNKLFSKYQYVHGNDINIKINRATNLSLYGENTEKNEFVISAEVPTKINSDIWNKSDEYKDHIWNELKKMKMVDLDQKYENYKIFKLEKTLSVPLVDFEDTLKKLSLLINEKYMGKIYLPGMGTFTRNIFMESLNTIFNNEK